MNSKWLPLTAVIGVAATLISQAISPASADKHDDWTRRHRNDARNNRYSTARYHRTTPLHNRATSHNTEWNNQRFQQEVHRYQRGNTQFHRAPSATWKRSNTEHREWQHH